MKRENLITLLASVVLGVSSWTLLQVIDLGKQVAVNTAELGGINRRLDKMEKTPGIALFPENEPKNSL